VMSTNVFESEGVLLKLASCLERRVDYLFIIFGETGEKDCVALHSFKVL
jgi:hypothetical protein